MFDHWAMAAWGLVLIIIAPSIFMIYRQSQNRVAATTEKIQRETYQKSLELPPGVTCDCNGAVGWGHTLMCKSQAISNYNPVVGESYSAAAALYTAMEEQRRMAEINAVERHTRMLAQMVKPADYAGPLNYAALMQLSPAHMREVLRRGGGGEFDARIMQFRFNNPEGALAALGVPRAVTPEPDMAKLVPKRKLRITRDLKS